MTPSKILNDLCAQYGLPIALGQRLLPLVTRGVEAAPAVRDRILALVGRTIEREAERYRVSSRERELDSRMLSVLAKVVHPWAPPGWLDPTSPDNS